MLLSSSLFTAITTLIITPPLPRSARFCSLTISLSSVLNDRHAEELQQEKNDRAADKQTCVVLDCRPLASCSVLERKWTCSYWATLCAALFVFVLTFTIVIITTATNHKQDHHHDDDHQLTNQHNHVLAPLLLHHLVSSVLDRHAEELQQEKHDRAADMETCVVLDCFGAQIICFLPFALKATPRSEKHCVLFFSFLLLPSQL